MNIQTGDTVTRKRQPKKLGGLIEEYIIGVVVQAGFKRARVQWTHGDGRVNTTTVRIESLQKL